MDEPNENNFTFTGRVKILINCTRPTNKIVLNWDDLNITESDVKLTTTQVISTRNERETNENDTVVTDFKLLENATDENIEYSTENVSLPTTTEEPIVVETKIIPMLIQDVVMDEDNFKMTIISRNLLETGHTYTIDIKFNGKIENNLVGLYRTKYVDLDGNSR